MNNDQKLVALLGIGLLLVAGFTSYGKILKGVFWDAPSGANTPILTGSLPGLVGSAAQGLASIGGAAGSVSGGITGAGGTIINGIAPGANLLSTTQPTMVV